MRRFAQSFVAGLGGVVVLGAVVLAISNVVAAGSPPVAESVSLSQVEDDGVEAEPEGSPVAPTLSPVERLLAQLVSPTEGTGLPAAQRVLLSRDPFAPVIPEAPVDGAGDEGPDESTDDGSTAGGDTDAPGTDDGGSSDGGSDVDGGADDNVCAGNESETVCDGVVVTLDTITSDGAAVVTVDGTSYTVADGEEFATSFRVLGINPPCATLLYGDEAFSICSGATVLK